YRLPESELFALTGTNQWEIWQNYTVPNPEATRIWSRNYEVVEERNVTIRQVVTLTDELDNELAPGIYFIEVAQPGSTSTDDPAQAVDVSANANNVRQALIVISNLNLTLKKSDSADS